MQCQAVIIVRQLAGQTFLLVESCWHANKRPNAQHCIAMLQSTCEKCEGGMQQQGQQMLTCRGVVKCCVKATSGDSMSSVTVGKMQCSGTRVSLSTNNINSPMRTSPPARKA